MKKVDDQTVGRNVKRRFAFAIGGSEVNGLMTVCNSIGIFGIITFAHTGGDAGMQAPMQQKLKEMFEGLMKYELCSTNDFTSVFKDIQHVIDEVPEWSTMGQISCTLIAFHADGLSLTSSDGKTRVKIVREHTTRLEVEDVTQSINQCLLGGGLGISSRKFPVTVTRRGRSDDRFLVIQNGNDRIDLEGLLLYVLRSAQSLEQIVRSLRGAPSGPIIVVDLREQR